MGISLQAWEEDGLGAQGRFAGQSKAGRVCLVREYERPVSQNDSRVPTLSVDAAELLDAAGARRIAQARRSAPAPSPRMIGDATDGAAP